MRLRQDDSQINEIKAYRSHKLKEKKEKFSIKKMEFCQKQSFEEIEDQFSCSFRGGESLYLNPNRCAAQSKKYSRPRVYDCKVWTGRVQMKSQSAPLSIQLFSSLQRHHLLMRTK